MATYVKQDLINMNLQTPQLGPIVGHTTATTCRLWIAAYNSVDEDEISANTRTVGIIGVVGENDEVGENDIFYFRLHRKYHRTGAFTLGEDVTLWKNNAERNRLKPFLLSPATHYKVRMAYIKIEVNKEETDDDSSEEVAGLLMPASDWKQELNIVKGTVPYVSAEFKTQPDSTRGVQPLSFIFGSCRNNWFNGIPFAKKKESDQIFKAMFTNHSDANFVLMAGDQVYADSLNFLPIAKADTYKEFEDIYHENFGSTNFRNLVSHIPTYMILDDHEIEDNWTQDRVEKNGFFRSHEPHLFNCAISAYKSYQWIHGPRFVNSYIHQKIGSLTGSDKYLAEPDIERRLKAEYLFYDFNCCGYPFFVLDTRTSRFKNSEANPDDDDSNINNNYLLGRPSLHPSEPSQLDRLCAWLRHMQADYKNRPKFIVSSGVFVPNEKDTVGTGFWARRKKNKSDSWPAFPQARNEILKTIIKYNIENVIFISGDIHCSNISRMEIKDTTDKITHVWSVTCSPFYWPFSFINGDPAKYVHDSTDFKTPDSFEIFETLTSDPSPNSLLGVMHYKAWAFTQSNSFCKISIDDQHNTLSVQFFNTEGLEIRTMKQNDSMTTQPEIIQLVKWKS